MPLIVPPKQPSRWRIPPEDSARDKTCPADMVTLLTRDTRGGAWINASIGAQRVIQLLLACSTIECSNNSSSNNNNNSDITTTNNNIANVHRCSEILHRGIVIWHPTPTPSRQHPNFPPSNRPNNTALRQRRPLRASRKAAFLSCETSRRHPEATQAPLQKLPLPVDQWLKARQAKTRSIHR